MATIKLTGSFLVSINEIKSHAVIFSCWWLFSTTMALLILITTVGFVTTVVKYSCSYAGQ